MSPELSKRLAPLNDTKYFFSKGYSYYNDLIKAAEKAETFDNLSMKYQNDVFAAEKEIKKYS